MTTKACVPRRPPLLLALAVLCSTLSLAHAAGVVSAVKVQPDKAPDCSSLAAIVKSVTKDYKTNDEKAVAIYNFMNLTHYHLAYPNEPGGISALKEINCYGWSLCGGLHLVQSALWRELGWKWRFVGWSNPGHTTVEAFYDGRWHYVDIFLKFYAWMPDGKGGRTIAGEEDLKDDPENPQGADNVEELLTNGFVLDAARGCMYAKDHPLVAEDGKVNWQAPAFLSCGDTMSSVISGLQSSKDCGSPDSWIAMKHANDGYSADVNLAPGFSLTNGWDALPDAFYFSGGQKAPAHTCRGHKDTRNDPNYGLILEPYVSTKVSRGYGNGSLDFHPDFTSSTVLNSFEAVENIKYTDKSLVPADPAKPAFVVVKLATPYIITKASGSGDGVSTVEISVDDGQSFAAGDLADFGEAVYGKLSALVKIGIKAPLKALTLHAVFQNNPGALPYLSPGKNSITVSVKDPQELGGNKLVVTYAYMLGSRKKSLEQLIQEGKEIAKQNSAHWSDTVTYAQKTFLAKDLPATFEIDCSTPQGDYPVYPRMLFMRREVLSPSGTPLPMTVGVTVGAAAVAAATERLAVPLKFARSESAKGDITAPGPTPIRWPKTSEEAESGKVVPSAIFLSGELAALKGRKVVSASLILPVVSSHDKAPTKIGVVLLTKPLEEGKANGVNALGEPVAFTVLPTQPEDAPAYSPAKEFAVDITKAVKALAESGAACYGFAVRVIPDRAIDEGYTVNCKFDPKGAFRLETGVAH